MSRLLFAAAVGLFAAAAVPAAQPPKAPPGPHVGLKDHVNVKLDENLHSDQFAGNNLKALPTGKQKLGEVTFEIGDGVLQLAGNQLAGKPAKIEGIKVGRAAKKLHFLHGTGYSTDDGTVIAKYVVRYEDKTTAEVEVQYGRDVVDWWATPDQPAPTQGKAVWEGENEASKGFAAKIKLYLLTWENPHPDKVIATLDFVAPNPDQAAAPFLVAVTADGK